MNLANFLIGKISIGAVLSKEIRDSIAEVYLNPHLDASSSTSSSDWDFSAFDKITLEGKSVAKTVLSHSDGSVGADGKYRCTIAME